MANDADAVRKDLIKRGYRVENPTKRGATTFEVIDPRTGAMIARFPTHPKPGSWRRNLEAAIRRLERTGRPARSHRVPGVA
jgi:putative heme degradation protein